METQVTKELKRIIKEVTKVDVNTHSRKREIVEARSLYYTILKQIDKKKSLKSIGDTVNLNHATVIHSLKNYQMFEQFNPTLRLFKKEILSKLSYKSVDEVSYSNNSETIDNLNIKIINLNETIQDLQDTINELQKPRNKFNIIQSLENLLIDTSGTEQQLIILERLQAMYRMNRNIRL